MHPAIPKSVRGFLFDLDGVIFSTGGLYPGAKEVIFHLRQAGYAVVFLSNTTRKPAQALQKKLQDFGMETSLSEVITPSVVAAQILHKEKKRPWFMVAPETLHDFAEFQNDSKNPQVIVVGDLGNGFTPAILNQAFLYLLNGAELLALQKNRYWQTEHGLQIDAGGYVALLEYVAQKTARVVGKPQEDFFHAGLAVLNTSAQTTVMIGDDVHSDVLAAMSLGIFGVLVRTGKFRPQDLSGLKQQPDLILDSVADLLSK